MHYNFMVERQIEESPSCYCVGKTGGVIIVSILNIVIKSEADRRRRFSLRHFYSIVSMLFSEVIVVIAFLKHFQSYSQSQSVK